MDRQDFRQYHKFFFYFGVRVSSFSLKIRQFTVLQSIMRKKCKILEYVLIQKIASESLLPVIQIPE